MAKAVVNEDCIGCETCAGICSDVFEMEDGVAKVVKDNIDDVRDAVEEAVDSCPAGAISIEE